jgi:diguanylate cyclase (GGDEF)-like protein
VRGFREGIVGSLAQAAARVRGWRAQTATDPITGLAGARVLTAALSERRRQLSRSGGCAGVLVVDLDGLKLINDDLGHEAGDAAVAEVARRLRAATGDGALIARIGGDEFGVLVADSGTPEALARIARSLRDAVSARPIVLGSADWALDVTVGWTLMDGSSSPAEVLARADEKMYLAKRTGNSDPFDRVSALVVGLLEGGDEGLEQALGAAVAEVAAASCALVVLGDLEHWWPVEPDVEVADDLRHLAHNAVVQGTLVREGVGDLVIATPLLADGAPIGAFAVERRYPFGKNDRIALSRAGVALGQALVRSRETREARRRIRELEHLAFRDENTGLANRRALLAELERLEGCDAPVALLFLDFDGLRAVNNEHGYERGNDLLRLVTAALERTLAAGETAARLHGSGGDEFIVVCPGVDAGTAAGRAAALEGTLCTVELPADIAALYGGASVGHATRWSDESPLDFLERAAELMRERKQTRKAIAPPVSDAA